MAGILLGDFEKRMEPFDGDCAGIWLGLIRKNSDSAGGYTERDYAGHIRRVAKRLEAEGGVITEETEKQIINDYICDKNIQSPTRNRRMTYLRTYTRWLAEGGWRTEGYDPTKGLKRKKEVERPRVYKKDDINSLISSLDGVYQDKNTWDSLRNKVIIATMASTGARKCEIRSIRPNDVNLKAGQIYILSPKTQSIRHLIIPDVLAPLLENLLAAREQLVKQGRFIPATDPEARLFCGPRGKTIADSTLSHAWARNGKKFAPDGARLYDLRHFFGTSLGEGLMNPKDIMGQMGHSDVRTSMKYMHPDEEVTAKKACAHMNAVFGSSFGSKKNEKGKGQASNKRINSTCERTA